MIYEPRKIIKNLNIIGVDTRYISLYQNSIYINNLKFSKFSRKREEQFNTKYPDINVIRSKIFQKICIKTSRSIKNQIKPKDKIYIEKTGKKEDILLEIVLEPYKRKYGITFTNSLSESDKIASSKTLDDYVDNYISLMLNGEKITNNQEENTIYPLMHVPKKWIGSWIKDTNIDYIKTDDVPNEEIENIVTFLEGHIPNVSESIQHSVEYLDNNRID